MEDRMKRWLAVVSGSMALVALWALPPSVVRTPTPHTPPEELQLRQVELRVARDHAALRALRWSDSLSALLVRTAPGGVVLSPPVTEHVEPDRVRSWVDAQHDVLARLPSRDADMRVGVFWVPRDHAALPDVALLGRMQEITVVGERDGVPYCLRALPHTERIAFISGPSSDLAVCRLFAAYGRPGDAVEAWLEASSMGFARVPIPTFAADFAGMGGLPPTEPASRLFGRDRPRLPDESLTAQACLAGRVVACERALTEPGLIAEASPEEAWIIAETPVAALGTHEARSSFGYLDDALLFEWEARWGSDAFARFWTSSEPVPEAFEAAFGEPLAEWVRGWVGRHVGLYRAGPSLPWSSVWTSVLALAALAAVATAAGVRRRVG